ncbi:Stk1 family PASTA domain-containing Ser/Thr kinase [Demequina lignilytica]|uniref:non-specific serine/threonine protein kinase n=1 Tax=Demequina lignilytica TaxID=3051663 RepID=A0AB35MIC3_9MICO|nr:Stk1 family PASTA domain-containing Ser/Thr kinase [Demequina sp. SYSU T0a273]MDN4483415.1 Stk1 family PASTA domain-containing Ser/Thr kinase [Demequina sp. SYSU T0a273]
MNDDPKILAGRYEVGDLIGRGGMAEVHVGYDTRLGRTVAIKILRADLARDPSFQTRFRREAQAAAGLNHPSIVAVYDTGEDTIVGASGQPQAVPFIVMEYVEGHTVREILKGDVAAPIDEAVEITAGVLAALDYSHHAGLVHRDIKPANIMLTPTGAVKVMDFGIARALADAGQTMTQTQAVVGTAQYLSPEQARGEHVDARSDLYSTGCVLFELLTGRPPFVGDSPVSVAYQHVREPAPQPSQFASDVPAELDKVVLRALSKNRDERYSSAQEFLADLRAVIAGDAVAPTTGAIALGSAAFGAGVAGVAAAAAAGAGGPETGATEIMPEQAAGTAVMAGGPWANVAPGSVPPGTGSVPVTEEVDPDEARRKKIMQWSILAAAILAAALLIGALWMLTRGGPAVEPSPSASAVAIPVVEGLTEDEAVAALEELGLVPTVETEPSDDVDKDLATRTDPPAGQQLAEGASIVLYISAGPDVVTVPDVRSLTEEQAISELEDAGLRVTRTDTTDDGGIDEGRAVETSPAAGEEVANDSTVTLYLSSGKVDLPDLTGMSESDARAAVTELGLIPQVTYQEFAQGPYGEVESQSPSPSRVDNGTTVTLTVGTQPSTVAVPDVTGMSESNAKSEIQGAGLQVGAVSTDTTDPQVDKAGTVKSTNPKGGTQVTPDTLVDIVMYCDVQAVITTPDPADPANTTTDYVCK